MALIQRTPGSIDVTNEYLFDILDKIKAKEQFDSDIKLEAIFIASIEACFSFTFEKKIRHYIYTPDDKGELIFNRVEENSIDSFFVDTKIIEKEPIAIESIKNDLADKKPRWDLLPIEELAGVVDVYTAGAKKYGENRWQTLPNGVNRYLGAFFRHLTAYKRGEQFDPEDGCLHLDKCIWNMIAVRHCFLADKGINPNTSDYSALQQPNGKD